MSEYPHIAGSGDNATISAAHTQHLADIAARRHTDAALHAASLIRQANEAIDHAAVLEREYWEVRHPPVIPDFITPKERDALLTAANLALEAIDNDDV